MNPPVIPFDTVKRSPFAGSLLAEQPARAAFEPMVDENALSCRVGASLLSDIELWDNLESRVSQLIEQM